MNHPCFNKAAHARYGRMHLPVAPKCNIQCGFCDRRSSCLNESRPGVTARVISPTEAAELAIKAASKMPYLSVAGIAGPGDPLANPAETLETLRLIKNAIPHLLLCLSTNGLALPIYIDELPSLGVRHITVTVNAVNPDIGALIYKRVMLNGESLTGKAGAEALLTNQMAGIARSRELGLTVKVNMVIIPGINDSHAEEVARQTAKAGASLMNCIPMAAATNAPLARHGEPTGQTMQQARKSAEKWLPQIRHCARCRADAIGLLNENHILEEIACPGKAQQIAGGA